MGIFQSGKASVATIDAELSGTAGITTFPEPASAADAVSIAEVLSWISARNSVPGGINPFGSVYYVAASGGSDSATGGGLDPNEPMATIAATITAGAAGDTIVLGPGDHSVNVSSAALIPKADMRFVGAIAPHGGLPSTIISVDADDGNDMITVDVDGVVFENIMFQHFVNAGTAIRLVDVSATTAVSGLTFVDCWFDMNSADVSGGTALNIDHASNVVTGLVLKNCHFVGGDATSNVNLYIDIGVGGIKQSLIEHCVFCCESTDDDYAAISFADASGAAISYGTVIRYNSFIGPTDGAVTLVPILTPAGSSGEYPMQWHSNFFSYCTVNPLPVDQLDQGMVNNYVGDLTAGGTLVDSGS